MINTRPLRTEIFTAAYMYVATPRKRFNLKHGTLVTSTEIGRLGLSKDVRRRTGTPKVRPSIIPVHNNTCHGSESTGIFMIAGSDSRWSTSPFNPSKNQFFVYRTDANANG